MLLDLLAIGGFLSALLARLAGIAERVETGVDWGGLSASGSGAGSAVQHQEGLPFAALDDRYRRLANVVDRQRAGDAAGRSGHLVIGPIDSQHSARHP
jgi:hypothetical protein